MPAPLPAGRRPRRRDSLPIAVALAALLTACGPTTRTETQTPARVEEPGAAPRSAGTMLMDAEGVNLSFAAIPAAVDDAPVAGIGAPAAQIAALRQAADRAYREEGTVLREALAADTTVPADATDVVRSLDTLAKAHDAAVVRPWTGAQTVALDRALAASPNRQAITALAALMAASRFAGERALTARRMAWALERSRRGGPPPSLSDASDQVAGMIAATREAEDARGPAQAGTPGAGDHALVQALMKLPATDIATLTAWYGSAAGKAAKERLAGGFQGANDRAGRAMLIDFLTHAGPAADPSPGK